MTKTDIRNTLTIGSIFAFRMFGLFMVLPVISVYAQHVSGATPFLVGVAIGIYGLTQGLFQLPFGLWSDYFPRRKVIAIGLIIFALGSVVVASTDSIAGIIAGRALQGTGAIGSCLIALLSDLVGEKDRTKAMAVMGIMIGSSFVIAIVIGPLLTHWLSVPALFWLTAVLALIGLGLVIGAIPSPTRTHLEFQPKQLPHQLKAVFFAKKLWRLNASILISHMLLTGLFVGFPEFLLTKLQLPMADQWHLYLPALVISLLIVGPLLRKQRESHREFRLVFYSAAVIVIAELLILLAFIKFPSFGLLLVALTLFFSSFTLLEAILPSQVSKAANPAYRGAATGLFSTCQFFGIFLGGILGGFLVQKYQYFGDCVGCLLLAIFWFLIMLPCQSKH